MPAVREPSDYRCADMHACSHNDTPTYSKRYTSAHVARTHARTHADMHSFTQHVPRLSDRRPRTSGYLSATHCHTAQHARAQRVLYVSCLSRACTPTIAHLHRIYTTRMLAPQACLHHIQAQCTACCTHTHTHTHTHTPSLSLSLTKTTPLSQPSLHSTHPTPPILPLPPSPAAPSPPICVIASTPACLHSWGRKLTCRSCLSCGCSRA